MRLCVFHSLALVLPDYNMHYIQANLGDIKQALSEYQCLFGVVFDYHSSALHFSRVGNISCDDDFLFIRNALLWIFCVFVCLCATFKTI